MCVRVSVPVCVCVRVPVRHFWIHYDDDADYDNFSLGHDRFMHKNDTVVVNAGSLYRWPADMPVLEGATLFFYKNLFIRACHFLLKLS